MLSSKVNNCSFIVNRYYTYINKKVELESYKTNLLINETSFINTYNQFRSSHIDYISVRVFGIIDFRGFR